ncbi:hypothetical protein TRIATDRAFT_210863 [Trichoderma atroviride IMI 206040]|uniref:Uncharacterized protein n=1 Tax=Hypocrea atroviridis (strain ATCC 20476 / IMI 206040) TaxID=452589 RepID=G9NF11_HYPAI|nr:uncharacterized protein TRIATDRAFT_210863 [Trichoderma atroviride IMI 206040]EHK50530.1 hypothetical protein TRIATDRAFT_210863 [Trichoderma atroviride IMI 206040]
MDKEGVALVPYKNGFVNGIIRAFQQDLHLVLRADDMWLAIMTQFSSYVNGHSEEMREMFVSHKGKKELVVDVRPQSIATIDFQHMASLFAGLIQENVVDPGLKQWMLPDFSTTTAGDVGVAAMVMMATMQAYFEYNLRGGCGFPSVTLLGERADWVHLVQKVEKLATYGGELAAWSQLLIKIAEKMVETFDQPDSQSIKDFWMRAVHTEGANSSRRVETLSGWLTAFCYWNEKGTKTNQRGDKEKVMSSGEEIDNWRLVVDGVAFPIIAARDVPRATAEVPVTVLDYGTHTRYDTTVIAGFVGVESTASKKGEPNDTVQPRAGYWVLIDEARPMP